MEKQTIERRYPKAPLVGVAGVVISGENVLLVQRGKAPGKGEWNIPGGLVEVGETLQEAVKREIREETGLDVEVRSLLEVSDRIIRDEAGKVRYHYVLLDYLCAVAGGTLSPASDAADARWVSMERLSDYDVIPPVRNVIEKALELNFGSSAPQREGEKDG